MSWDIYWYELKFGLSNYVKEMDTDVKDIAIYHTMGNHDNDFKMYGDFDKEEDYRDVLAPTFYSYNIGKVHYVVLDDIDYTGVEASGFDASGKLVAPDNRGKYTENFTTEQLDWLRKDLSYVSKSTPIVLSAHAPVYRPNGVNAFKAGLGTSRGYGKTAQLESVLSGYKVHIFTGHTHKTFNYDRYSTNGIFEHNAGSVCGSWWWSGHYVNGINLAPKAKIAEWHYNYGPNPFKLMVNKREAADIDDIYDYVCALAMYDMPDITDLNDPRLLERFKWNG